MTLIIDIPEEEYKCLDYYQSLNQPLFKAIKNGILLDDVLDKIKGEIEPKCDRINSLASVLPYTAHREIQELLCEIMDKYTGVSE